MKVLELRNSVEYNIRVELLSLLKEQFNLRIQMSSGKLKKPHLLKLVRRNIARIKTIIKEKEIVKNDKNS